MDVPVIHRRNPLGNRFFQENPTEIRIIVQQGRVEPILPYVVANIELA